MNNVKMMLAICVFVVLYACKGNVKSSGYTSSGTSQDKSKHESMKFKLSAINDPLITKGAAIIFLLPDGWIYDGKIDWDFSNNTFPSNPHGYFQSADKAAQYISLPTYFFIQMSQMMYMSGMKIGSKYLGSTIVENGYVNAESATKEVLNKLSIIPAGTKFTDIKSQQVQSQNPADISAQQANPGTKFINEVVTMEGTCIQNNIPYKVYVIANVNGISDQQIAMMSWSVRPNIFIIKQDQHTPVYESQLSALYKSFRATKNYLNCAQQVSQMLSNNFYTGVRQAGAISQQISRNNDAMIASIDAQYTQANNSASNNSGFNDYIKGVENYADGNGYQYELPSSYSHAWKNGNGEIILSNEHGYDPNIGSTQSWQELSK